MARGTLNKDYLLTYISLPFIAVGPGTDFAGQGDIKLPNQSCPVFGGSF